MPRPIASMRHHWHFHRTPVSRSPPTPAFEAGRAWPLHTALRRWAPRLPCLVEGGFSSLVPVPGKLSRTAHSHV